MTSARSDPTHRDPTLAFDDGGMVTITSAQELRDALSGFESFRSGSTLVLARGGKDYIKAVRHGDFWSVVTRHGGYLTLASFTAEMTTEYSERRAREDRAAGSLWKRFANRVAAPPPERALTSTQVETLFAEYLVGRRFSIPQSGA